jgi:light-regulated signal transduction histidine kinase (bacteriophytochrome)
LVKFFNKAGELTEDGIEKMFDPFSTSKDLGNGMGLFIARGIVFGHGGAVDIESILGSGTTGSIVVPIVKIDAKLVELPKYVNANTPNQRLCWLMLKKTH